MQRAFTLIELLVVIAIIGILASVVLTSIAPARERARDARRIAELNQMQKALEVYYVQNKTYPAFTAFTTVDPCGSNWCALEAAMQPYMERLPRDPLQPDVNYPYFYDSNAGDNYQSYGLMARMENPSNYWRVDADGGYYDDPDCCYYEVGPQPAYCMQKYAASGLPADRNWWPLPGQEANVCRGGN